MTTGERQRRWGIGLVLAGALATVLLGRAGGCTEAGVTPVAQRGAARAISLTTMDGRPWSLADHRGQVVLVNVWATWCGPCREETPELVRLARAGGVSVLGVSIDTGEDREAKVRDFVREYGVEYPVAIASGNFALTREVESIPRTMVFDRQGRMAKVWVGEFQAAAMRKDLATLEAER